MGIRFDRDSKRATNGPMIFFSDPSSQGSLAEEIRGALISGLSFYCYRLPGDLMISFGSSEGFVEDFGEPGFVIGRFEPDAPIITIPYKGIKSDKTSSHAYYMPDRSTAYEAYCEEVSKIILSLQDNHESKVVIARVDIRLISLDLTEQFFEFCERFPESMVYCFSTPATGCWIGASPELLLEGSQGYLKTMALAGTRMRGSEGEWDIKNREEQKIVTKYIDEIFKSNGFVPEIGKVFTRATGAIEHICTPIEAIVNKKDPDRLESLIKDLSPTPALCGYPKDFAIKEIKHLEKFDRGCYGGFCGPFHSVENFIFNVVLRCASVDEKKICIYAGGGITWRSVAEAEWKETELKINNTFSK